MSKLRHYLHSRKMSYAAFGARIGKDKSTVSRIIRGTVTVDRKTAARIFKETGGAVTPNDLFGIPPHEEPVAS